MIKPRPNKQRVSHGASWARFAKSLRYRARNYRVRARTLKAMKSQAESIFSLVLRSEILDELAVEADIEAKLLRRMK